MPFARGDNLRARHGHDHHRVTYIELFFDLVFVFAITQLSHGLLHQLTPIGALETALLQAAKARGLKTADGLGMLLHQAVRGFELWFGQRPQVTPELRALVEADLIK